MSFAEPIDYNMIPSAAQVPNWNGPAGTYGICKSIIEASSVASWVSTLIVASIAITIAWLVNTERTSGNSGHKSFLWGYFIAFSGGIDGVWIFLCHLRLAACLQPSLNIMAAMYGAALIFFSYAAYKRSKIGWIGATALSLNPIWWVINYLYARKRWDEFSKNVPFPSALALWRPVQVQLKLKRFKEQHKLLYQNLNAAAFLVEHFATHHPEEAEVIKLCKDAAERASAFAIKAADATYVDAADLEALVADNREMRRLYDFNPTAQIKPFDAMFQPMVGWGRYYERKAEDAPMSTLMQHGS